MSNSSTPSDLSVARIGIEQEELLKAILQFLEECGLIHSLRALEQETGMTSEPLSVEMYCLRDMILRGQWSQVVKFISPLQGVSGCNLEEIKLRLCKQEFIEKLRTPPLDRNDTYQLIDHYKQLVASLQKLSTLGLDQSEHRRLSMLLTLPEAAQQREFKDWSVQGSRLKIANSVVDQLSLVMQGNTSDKGSDRGSKGKEDILEQNDIRLGSNKHSELKRENSTGSKPDAQPPNRLVNLVAKGLLYEKCEEQIFDNFEYCITQEEREKALNLPQILEPYFSGNTIEKIAINENGIPYLEIACETKQTNSNSTKQVSDVYFSRQEDYVPSFVRSITPQYEKSSISSVLAHGNQTKFDSTNNNNNNHYNHNNVNGHSNTKYGKIKTTNSQNNESKDKYDTRQTNTTSATTQTTMDIKCSENGTKPNNAYIKSQSLLDQDEPNYESINHAPIDYKNNNDNINNNNNNNNINNNNNNNNNNNINMNGSKMNTNAYYNVSILNKIDPSNMSKIELKPGEVPPRPNPPNGSSNRANSIGHAFPISHPIAEVTPEEIPAPTSLNAYLTPVENKIGRSKIIQGLDSSTPKPDKQRPHMTPIPDQSPIQPENVTNIVDNGTSHEIYTKKKLSPTDISPPYYAPIQYDKDQPCAARRLNMDCTTTPEPYSLPAEELKKELPAAVPPKITPKPVHWVIEVGKKIKEASNASPLTRNFASNPDLTHITSAIDNNSSNNNIAEPQIKARKEIPFRALPSEDVKLAREAAAIAEKRRRQHQMSPEREHLNGKRHSIADELDPQSSADELSSHVSKRQNSRRQSSIDRVLNTKNGNQPQRCHSSADKPVATYQPHDRNNSTDKQLTSDANLKPVDKQLTNNDAYYKTADKQLINERNHKSADKHLANDKNQPPADRHNIPIANEEELNPSVHLVGMLKDSQVVRSSSFHPTSPLLAVGANSKTLYICRYTDKLLTKAKYTSENTQNNRLVPIECYRGYHRGSIYCLAWNTTGSMLASGSNDQTIKLLNFAGRNENIESNMNASATPLELHLHTGTVRDLCFTSDCLLVSGGSGDNLLKVVDINMSQTLLMTLPHENYINSIYALSENSVVTASLDRTVRIWDLRSKNNVWKVDCGELVPSGVCGDHKNRGKIAASCEDGSVIVWDRRNPSSVFSQKIHHMDTRSICFRPNTSDTLMTGSYDGQISLIYPAQKISHVLTNCTEKIIQAKFSPQGSLIASTSTDRTVKLWEFETSKAS